MMNTTALYFHKMPSLLNNLAYIATELLLRKTHRPNSLTTLPDIYMKLQGFRISPKHHLAFNTMCAIEPGRPISPIYPMTLVFPFFQRMLGLKQAPLPVFNALGKHLHIRQYCPLDMDPRYDIVARFVRADIVPKGFELDMAAVIECRGIPVWETVCTVYYRGQYGPSTRSDSHFPFVPLADADETVRWHLPAGMGFRFARISGDGNGIHFSKAYARILGFERDFAQPFLVLGNAVNHVAEARRRPCLSLDVAYKGPLYYERDVIMKSARITGANRFDLYSVGNPRPCMTGLITIL